MEAHTRQPSTEGLKLSECLQYEAMLRHTVFRPACAMQQDPAPTPTPQKK